MKRNNIINLIFFSFLLSCSDNKKSNKLMEYYDNGNVFSETEFILVQGDTIKEGYSTTYYPNGKKKSVKLYIANKLGGLSVDYFDNGNKASESHFSKGKKIGSESYFYENGAIMQYKLYDHLSALRLIIKYDSLGKVMSKEGVLIASTLINKDDYNNIKLGDTVDASLIIATPFGCETKIDVEEELNGKRIKSYNLPIEANAAKYRVICSTLGNHKVITNVQVIDTINNERYTDSDTSVFRIK